jgi:hypothetical protein
MTAHSTLIRSGMLLALTAALSMADNGIVVSVYCKSKGIGATGTNLRGSIVKRTMTNNSVGSPTTIFDWTQGGLAQYPVISLDGQHVAFWRWGVSQVVSGGNVTWVQRPGPLPNPNYYPDTNWLSVVKIDGTGLTNLVMVDIPSISSGEERLSAIAWPSGDWIYYEKPTNSWEIWRVNYKNPLLNEFVVKFVRSNPESPSWAPFFRRFSMSADARFAGGQLTNYTNTSFFNFPPPGGDVTSPGANLQGTGGCNTAMSASGTYIAHYLFGNHNVTYFKTYNGVTGTDAGSQNIQGGSEMIRWAANSDNWLTQVYAPGLADDGYDQWANQLVRDVKGSSTVFNTNNSNGWCNDAGQVWISGASNAESYMNRSGSWVAVPPVVPRDLTAPSTPTALQAQAQGAHAVRLTWGASSDAESGVFCYIIYRGGAQVGTSQTLAYADSGLTENTAYTYTVSAINRGNTESAKASASITTPVATQGAAIVSVDAACGPTTLVVTFDEPLDQTSAQTAANYTISGGTVSAASLSADGKKVTLTTGSMTAGIAHTLTLHNVLDTHAHGSSATANFTYEGLAHGLQYETYNVSSYDALPPAFTGTPVKSGVVRNFDNSNLGSSSAIRFKGYLKITTPGTYEIKMCAYYNAALTLDGDRIAYTEESYSGQTWMATPTLTAGLYTLNVDVSSIFGDLWLYIWYAGPDGIQHRISDNMLFYAPNGAPVAVNDRRASTVVACAEHVRISGSYLDARVPATGHSTVTMASPNGAVVRSWKGSGRSSVRIPVAGLAAGVYFVRITHGATSTVRALTLR